MCVCLRNSTTKSFLFSLQWHVTAKCDQKCKHCYMYESPFFESELNNELSLKDCFKIIDDFEATLARLNKQGTIFFTGGDPILREDFFDILKYANSKKISPLGVMGNPFHIDKTSAKKLKENGVMMYQISLDGMKNTHDMFRKPGSFDETIRAYEVLKEAGIYPTCMLTLSKLNMKEIFDIIRLCAELELAAFDFDRLVPVGMGETLKDDLIDPMEYKAFLLEVKNEYKRLKKKGSKTQFGFKDNLWGLVLEKDEEAEFQTILPSGLETKRGCLIGEAGLVLLADGNTMACRRLPILVGKLPEQSMEDIFLNSSALNELKNMRKVEICGQCDNYDNCKGCRAVAFGASGGNYYAKDPGCWL